MLDAETKPVEYHRGYSNFDFAGRFYRWNHALEEIEEIRGFRFTREYHRIWILPRRRVEIPEEVIVHERALHEKRVQFMPADDDHLRMREPLYLVIFTGFDENGVGKKIECLMDPEKAVVSHALGFFRELYCGTFAPVRVHIDILLNGRERLA